MLEVTVCGPVMLLWLGREVLRRMSSSPKPAMARQQRGAARYPAVMLTALLYQRSRARTSAPQSQPLV